MSKSEISKTLKRASKGHGPKPKPEGIDIVARALNLTLNTLFDLAENQGVPACALTQTLISSLVSLSIENDHDECAAETCVDCIKRTVQSVLDKGRDPTDIDPGEGATIVKERMQ